jgi:hypothetical protein
MTFSHTAMTRLDIVRTRASAVLVPSECCETASKRKIGAALNSGGTTPRTRKGWIGKGTSLALGIV